jgi:hypothetical protein
MKPLTLAAALLACSSLTLAQSFPARLEKSAYRGWQAYRLSNGLVTLIVTPDIGGRVIQLQLGDQELLFVNPDLAGKVLPEERNNPKAGWANYGGDKVWPAPQGWAGDDQWPGPPHYTLDGSRYAPEVVSNNSGEVSLRVTSPRDPRTGIRFSRTFHVYAGTTRVRVDQTMRNISKRRVRWGIWHVMQHNAADTTDASKPNPDLYAYAPANPASRHPGGFKVMFGDPRHPSYQRAGDPPMLTIRYLYQVGKLGADSNAGWLAVVNGQTNTALVEEFRYFPDQEYPDGASIEFWNNGPGTVSGTTLPDDPAQTPYFFESEVLSPFAQLDPGEEYTFPVYWMPVRAPNPIRAASWAGVTSEPLSVLSDGQRAVLRGVFGVFLPAAAEAVFYDRTGAELNREALGAADPREVFRLDKAVPMPPEAFRVSVVLRDFRGENLGALAGALVP